jgi:large subunit ribosomal protein L10
MPIFNTSLGSVFFMNTNIVTKNRQKKEVIVAELVEKVGKAKAFVLADYKGMTHKQIEDLKKNLKTIDAEMVVTKNTLFNIALTQNKIEPIKDLQGPSITLFAYADVVGPLKELAKVIKALKLPVVKVGFMEGSLLSAEQVAKLATLPPREVLLAQMVGLMQSPITGLVITLNANIQKLAMVLKAIESKKQASS